MPITPWSLGAMGATDLNVTAAIGLGGPSGTFVTVRFDLGGMVFSEAVMGTNLAPGTGHRAASLRSGGQVGDAHVSFIATREMNTDAATLVILDIDQLGVKPGVPGSVTMMVTDSVGDAAEHSASYSSAVRTMRALQETPTPMNLVATVEERFMSFGGMLMGTLGSFEVGMVTPALKNAATGHECSANWRTSLRIDDTSSVTISGDFSFASMAWLQTAPLCVLGG